MGTCYSAPVAQEGAPAAAAAGKAAGVGAGGATVPLAAPAAVLAAAPTPDSSHAQELDTTARARSVEPAGAAAGGSGSSIILAPSEDERLRTLRALNIISTAPDPRFDSITALMKQMFDTPVATVSLIDEELLFLARQGEWACSAGRAGSFCDWILVPDQAQVLVVENAAVDARFKSNKFVSGPPYICFYAGAPLISSVDGHRYGTLCVFDFKPRTYGATHYAMLAHFAEIVVREMEREMALELSRKQLLQAQDARTHVLRAMDCFHEGIILLDLAGQSWQLLYVNDAFRQAAGMPRLLDVSTSSDQRGGRDFWQLFGHASSSGGQELYEQALAAMASGQDFMLHVQPLPAAGSSGSSGTSGSAAAAAAAAATSGQQAPVLSILFRPADSDGLRPDVPHIGIPAFVDAVAGSRAASTVASTELALAPSQQAAAGGGGRQQLQLQQQQQQACYYFGILRQHQEGAADLQASGGLAVAAEAARAASQDGSEGLASANASGSLGSLPAPGAALIPSFYQQRPDVMSEVTLGPLIGTGSMGRCYRGMWQGGRVAVKIVDCWVQSEGGGGGGLQPQFEEGGEDALALGGAGSAPHALGAPVQQCVQAAVVEALLARSLSHPHIVTTFCHGMSKQQVVESTGRVHQAAFIVQEYCNRGSLLDGLASGMLHHQPEGGPNMHAILATSVEIAGALSYLHSHDVIHGDLTPSNVLLTSSTKDARRWIAKVADFGLAQYTSGVKELSSQTFGTVTHMPPELLATGTMSKAVDVFSFGIILLEMFCGKRAWVGFNPMQIVAAVSAGNLPFEMPADAPPVLADLVGSCLHLDPSQRPPFTAILAELQVLASELHRSAASTPVPADSVPTNGQQEALQHQQQAAGSSHTSSGAFTPSVTIPAAPSLVSPFAAAAAIAPPSAAPSLQSPFALAAVAGRAPSTAVSPFAAAASHKESPKQPQAG